MTTCSHALSPPQLDHGGQKQPNDKGRTCQQAVPIQGLTSPIQVQE